jgi:vacuolar-type H+-ATPase subunit E/Vma4
MAFAAAVKDVQALRRIYEDALAECEEVRAHAEQLNTVATEREREVARIQGDLEAIQSTMRDQEGQLRVLSGRLQVRTCVFMSRRKNKWPIQ